MGHSGALNGVLEISCSQNYKNTPYHLSKNLCKILMHTLKIPANEFNFNNKAAHDLFVGLFQNEK